MQTEQKKLTGYPSIDKPWLKLMQDKLPERDKAEKIFFHSDYH